jgi:hypothetical protein
MVCMTDMALLHDYLEAADDFFDEVKHLNGQLSHEEFQKVIEDVHRARVECLRAREMMEQHRREHGCRRQD